MPHAAARGPSGHDEMGRGRAREGDRDREREMGAGECVREIARDRNLVGHVHEDAVVNDAHHLPPPPPPPPPPPRPSAGTLLPLGIAVTPFLCNIALFTLRQGST
jgi:hypothetical protein